MSLISCSTHRAWFLTESKKQTGGHKNLHHLGICIVNGLPVIVNYTP